jgi:hypothetical protein
MLARTLLLFFLPAVRTNRKTTEGVTMEIDSTKYPTLARLFAAGIVKHDADGWYGTASDGIDVSFGTDTDFVERILRAYARPSPTEALKLI